MKGGVQLLEIRPEQLTSNDLGAEQVLWNKTLEMCIAVCHGVFVGKLEMPWPPVTIDQHLF